MPKPIRTCSPLLLLAFLATLAVSPATLAGTITGELRVLAEPKPSHGPSSPFARRRPMEGHGPATPSADNRRVLVFLAEHPALAAPEIPKPNPVINQVDLEIVPGFMAVPVGTTVDFPNSDDVFHNLFSVSSARKFDLGRYGQGKVKDVTFRETGEVRIFCDIHPHMNAIVYVVPNEFHSQLDEQGRFRIDNVPPGEYELRAWHEDLGMQAKQVRVIATDTTEVNFTFGPN